jgi:hypothetical protein
MNSTKIVASLKAEDYPERDRLKAAIDRNETSDLDSELRIKALAEGRTLPVPATLESQYHDRQVKIRALRTPWPTMVESSGNRMRAKNLFCRAALPI